MGAARILIVDDYVLFRSSARRMLEAQGFDVIGESGDGRSAIAAVRALRPDVVLLDVQLPDLDGFEVARLLAKEPDPPAVILTSIRDAADYRGRLPDTPARGFIPKAELSGPAISHLLGTGR
ncbi:response regulator transcription factor [Kribbella sp. NPDC026611]|uniref:response regulator n=1 Tax=Kribbella sp. NPDC026611 TaxID=3154911 RepID=UPI0033E9263B